VKVIYKVNPKQIMERFIQTTSCRLAHNGWQIGGRFNAANVLLPAVNIHDLKTKI
jgi:hypothetical protein